MSTPTDSDGILTETAGREQAAAEARLAAQVGTNATGVNGVPWESDPNRPDLVPAKVNNDYSASQVLALAVGVAVAGEDSTVTLARATAYKEWINQ